MLALSRLPFIVARVPGLITNSGQENNSSLEFITESVDSIYQADCRPRRKKQRTRKPYEQFVGRWLRFHGHSNNHSMKRKQLLSFKPAPSPYQYPAFTPSVYPSVVTTAYLSEASSDADNQHAACN